MANMVSASSSSWEFLKRAVKSAEVSDDSRVLDVRFVDGWADQALVQQLGIHVQHSLAVSVLARGSSVVHHVRRQDRHPVAGDAAVPDLEVVADRALVDDEHGPSVVCVRRVRVLDELRVEDLMNPWNRGLPSPDPLPAHVQDATIVQDPRMVPVLDGLDDEWNRPGIVMNELVGLVAFAFAGSVSPGPNNTVLWASGMQFGFRRTIPHVIGTAIGIGALVVGVSAGVDVLIETVPVVELALKLVGSVYLLYVAFLVVVGGAVGRTSVSQPMSLWQGVAFQCVNPKAWIFAVAAVGAFLPPALHRFVGVALLTGILMVIVAVSSSIWAAGGVAIGRVVNDERTRRVVHIALAVLLVGSVALIWI